MKLVAETTLALRLVSEANAHTHWRTRQKRAKEHRRSALLVLASSLHGVRKALAANVCDGVKVTIMRLAPRSLDSDNVVGAAKHVRDGVADALGIDDRDPRVTWLVEQERVKGRPAAYGVRIRVEA